MARHSLDISPALGKDLVREAISESAPSHLASAAFLALLRLMWASCVTLLQCDTDLQCQLAEHGRCSFIHRKHIAIDGNDLHRDEDLFQSSPPK